MTDICPTCETKVYPMEKTTIDGKGYHRACFKCTHCKTTLKYFIDFYLEF